MRGLRPPLVYAALAAAVLGTAAPARADYYGVVLQPSQGLTGGWSFSTRNAGFSICGLDAAVTCDPAAGLGWASGAAVPGVSIGNQNVVVASVTAPPGTWIAGGTFTLDTSLVHDQSFDIEVKTATSSQAVKNGTTVFDAPVGTASTPFTLASGSYAKLGVVLQATSAVPAGTVTGAGDDGFGLEQGTLVLYDSAAPTVSAIGSGTSPIGDGRWHDGSTCVPLLASDVGSGVTSLSLLVDGRIRTGSPTAWTSPLVPGQPSISATLCIDSASLGDGAHTVVAQATDASGVTTNAPLGTLLTDASAPSLQLTDASAAGLASAQPVIAVAATDAESGVSAAAAAIDGVPVPLSAAGGVWTGQPASPLAPGPHTLTLSATNGLGRVASTIQAFGVPAPPPPAGGAPSAGAPSSTAKPKPPPVDRTAPTVEPLVAAATETGAAVAFQASDPSGLAARSVHVTLDGSSLYPGTGTLVDGRYSASVPGPLAWGPHIVGVEAADLLGNVRDATWTFNVGPAALPTAPAAKDAGAWTAPGVRVSPAEAGRTLSLDAAVDEYEDARFQLRGVRGALAVSVDPAASDALLVAHASILQVTRTSVRGRSVQDPLPPLEPGTSVAGAADLLLRVSVPAGTRPGTYHGLLRVTLDGKPAASLPLTLHVWDVKLPRRDDPDAFRTLFLVSPQSYINAVDERTGDDPHASGPALTSGLMRLLSAYRVNPGDWGYGNPSDDGYVDGKGWWRRTRSLMLSSGQYPFSAMRLPISTQRAVASHQGPSARKPSTWGSWLRNAVQPLWRQQGWLGRSVVWGWDEPGDRSDRGVVSQQACTIHRSSPGTSYLLTDTLRAPRARRTVKVRWGRTTRSYTLPAEPSDNRQLWDGKGCNDVDTWVVLSRRYYGTYATPLETYARLDPAHAELRNIEMARSHGASVWSYTYTGVPGSPGYAADEPVTNPTVFMLWNALEGLGGTLYSDGMTTYKGLDPYRKLPGHGQSVLVYPSSSSYGEPVSSLRLEAIRDGVEDADLARLLVARKGRGALAAILQKERILSLKHGRVQLACTAGCDLPGRTKYAFPRYRQDAGTAAALGRVHRALLKALAR